MKIYFKYIGIILLTVIMTSCGSGGGGGGGAGSGDSASTANSGMSTLTVAIGNVSTSSGALTYTPDIPSTVKSVMFTVMINGSVQTRVVNVGGRTGIIEKFTGPNGTWDVRVIAYAQENAQGPPTHIGQTIQGVSGDTTIYVNMDPVVPKFRVFVSNIETGNVSAIDPLTFEIKTLNCTGTSCTNPRNLAANHDSSLSVYVPFSSSDNVFDVDADNPLLDFTNEIPHPDPDSSEPYAAAFTCNGMEAWVVDRGDPSIENDGSISIINTSTKDIENIYPTCLSNPVGIAIANGKAYIANTSSNTVCVIDTATRTEVQEITMAGTPRHVVATPDGSYVYVSTDLVIQKIITSNDTSPHKIGGGAWNLGVSPDGSRVYAGLGSDTIKFIDVNPDPNVPDSAGLITVGGSVSGSKSIYGVTVTSDGSLIFATDQNNNVVYAFGPEATTSGSVNPMIIPNSLGAYLPQAITSAPGVRTEACPVVQGCVPTLDPFPAAGSLADNAGPDCSDTLEWDFTWSECPGATSYKLQVTEPNAAFGSLLDVNTSLASYAHSTSTPVHSTSTPPSIITGLSWRVQAIFGALGSGDWSAEDTFDVEPENADCSAVACTRYIDDTGNDVNNDCLDPALPCRSITRALFEISEFGRSPDEVICVADGTFDNATGEQFPLQLPQNTGLLCTGANHTSVIQVSTQTSVWAVIPNGPGTFVDGCRITTPSGNNIMGIRDADVVGNDYPMTINNNLIDPWRPVGSVVDVANTGSVVSNNTLVGQNLSVVGGAWGIAVRNSATVTGNDISGYHIGIYVLDASNAVNTPTIQGNSIYCNVYANLFTDEYSPAIAGGPVPPINVTNNSWNNAPPSVLSVAAGSSGCGGVDICYYELAPVPVSDPYNAPAPACVN